MGQMVQQHPVGHKLEQSWPNPHTADFKVAAQTTMLSVSTNSASRLPAPLNLVRLCQHLAVLT